jgi:CBS domain-containing protein
MEVSATASAILAQRKDHTVWSIAPEATVFEAIELMAQKNVGALPVVEKDRLIGIISERDYTRKVILRGKSSKETPVKEIMTDQVLTVDPNTTVAECMQIMTKRRVRHLPVLDANKLVGILSVGDVLNWTISAQGAAIDNLETFIAGREPDL